MQGSPEYVVKLALDRVRGGAGPGVHRLDAELAGCARLCTIGCDQEEPDQADPDGKCEGTFAHAHLPNRDTGPPSVLRGQEPRPEEIILRGFGGHPALKDHTA